VQRRGRRKVQDSAKLVELTLRRHGLYEKVREQQAIVLWPQIVGPALDRVTQALQLREGTLLVRVQGAVWRSELHYMLPQLLQRLNDKLNKPLREIHLLSGGVDKNDKDNRRTVWMRARSRADADTPLRELIERARRAASKN